MKPRGRAEGRRVDRNVSDPEIRRRDEPDQGARQVSDEGRRRKRPRLRSRPPKVAHLPRRDRRQEERKHGRPERPCLRERAIIRAQRGGGGEAFAPEGAAISEAFANAAGGRGRKDAERQHGGQQPEEVNFRDSPIPGVPTDVAPRGRARVERHGPIDDPRMDRPDDLRPPWPRAGERGAGGDRERRREASHEDRRSRRAIVHPVAENGGVPRKIAAAANLGPSRGWRCSTRRWRARFRSIRSRDR